MVKWMWFVHLISICVSIPFSAETTVIYLLKSVANSPKHGFWDVGRWNPDRSIIAHAFIGRFRLAQGTFRDDLKNICMYTYLHF